MCLSVYCFQFAGYAFVPTEKEQHSRLLHVQYNSSKDQYSRVSNNAEVIHCWHQCVWSKESVFRNMENDWQMVRDVFCCFVMSVSMIF